MKKLIIFVVIIGLLGVGGWQLYVRVFSPGHQVCHKLADLCANGEMNADQLKSCKEGLAKLEEVTGPDKARKAGKCVLNSDSCMGAAGCMAGAGLGAAAEFLTGMKRSLQD